MSTDAHIISMVDSLDMRAYIQIRLKTEYDVAMHKNFKCYFYAYMFIVYVMVFLLLIIPLLIIKYIYFVS